MDEAEANVVPHVIMLPFPLQGHIKPMLKLAEILCSDAKFRITFLNSHRNHNNLSVADYEFRFPSLEFHPITDGLSFDHPRIGLKFSSDLFISTRSVTKSAFRELLISLKAQLVPVTCIIADGFMSFAIDVGKELNIPVMIFHTQSVCSWWIHYHLNHLIKEGELPFRNPEDLDRSISCIPGLENVLRRRDLPSICRFPDTNDSVFQFFLTQFLANTRASGIIINTFEELESPLVTRISSSLATEIYTIGPLHTLLKSRMTSHMKSHMSKLDSFSSSPPESCSGNLWKEDTSCIKWLDSQPLKSVLYVSFGSFTVMSIDQLMEFWHGLINSGKRFLWAIRPESINGEDDEHSPECRLPIELEEGIKNNSKLACIVRWAPQEMVLAHPAVGGFLTHGGWNSTLESLYAGVPMLSWPIIADQQVNSRCIGEMWRIGLDMKDTCDRLTIGKLVKELMEDKREELQKSIDEMARMARKSVEENGSSYQNLDKLIQHIRKFN